MLGPEVGVLVAEDELDGVEEVGLAGPVRADHRVHARAEVIEGRLVLVRQEPLDDHLLYVHGCVCVAACVGGIKPLDDGVRSLSLSLSLFALSVRSRRDSSTSSPKPGECDR